MTSDWAGCAKRLSVVGDGIWFDFNGDGLRDEQLGRDIAFGEKPDFDGDGEVQFRDFLILSQNFGKGPSGVAVPEPNGRMLLCLGLLGIVAVRRHRSR
jgi:hypothetical protein